MTVVETPLFLRKAAEILEEAERARLLADIGLDPECGEIIPGTGGVRKLRWALPGRGKRGGARVTNLTAAERNMLRSLTPELVDSYRKGTTP